MESDLRMARYKKRGWMKSRSAVQRHNKYVSYLRSLGECGKLDSSPVLCGIVPDLNTLRFTLDGRNVKDVYAYIGNDWGKYNYLREESWG